MLDKLVPNHARIVEEVNLCRESRFTIGSYLLCRLLFPSQRELPGFYCEMESACKLRFIGTEVI